MLYGASKPKTKQEKVIFENTIEKFSNKIANFNQCRSKQIIGNLGMFEKFFKGKKYVYNCNERIKILLSRKIYFT